ncbi:hypothetical protein Tdes44962_MAKER06926 [Teratosphaeria destructans]|uniref:Uncharacterized protein n=1 Tax=Teratosphaeria destructans TaxID=418781 RepID=A0A9W7T068_9PEZI|nr:hypothetical protein Tdes44962_MAKER06926 [Teratosphaeria destructans]
MLTGKQRPVPSKATLQVLYQLAYISSGTAVGIGFLCAEERRRRTQIVQRIADNAKKIRQSPRYAHNAAAAAVREAEEQFYRAPDVRQGPLDGEAEKRHRRRGLAAGFHDGAKGPELPSVVAEAYEQHQSSIEEGVAQSRRKHAPERLLAGSHDTHGDSSAADNINTGGRSITGDASVDTADSIGHDLRLARRSNHSSRQVVRPDHIEARLERVELLSSPGKPWDGILVFGSHERQVSDRSATSDSNETVDEHDHTGRDHDLISQPAHHPPAVADPNEHLLEHCHDISKTVDQMASHESSPARLSDRAPAECDVEFSDLRVPYKDVCSVSQDESAVEKELDDVAPGLDELDLKPERDMILALSAGEYEKVLSLYKASTHKAQSFRNSPLALEIAVEASLRRRIGDPAEAMQLMKQAHAAGLNATIAMGPVLIHRMRSLNFEDHKNLENLRTTAIDYYRLNDENGWPVKHHVGVAAASIMINGGQPRHGLNLLDAIFRSDYSRRRPLGIVAMSVYLQGYARIKNFTGIEWVVGQVLEQNMRIDRAFCHILKRCAKAFSSDDVLDFDGTRRQDLQQKQVHMRHLLEKCRARRLEQRVGFYKLGQALVKTLVSVAKQQARPVIDLAPVAHIETPASGVDGQTPASTEMLGSEDNVGDTPHSIIEQRSRRRRLAFLTRLGGGLQPGRSKARAKHRPYRRFLQPQMIGGERIYLSFRYHLPGPGAGHDRKPGAIRSPDPFDPVGGAPMNMRTLQPVSEDG